MIILRTKKYSAPTTKAIFKAKQARNSVRLGAAKKTRGQVMRETIKTKWGLDATKQNLNVKKEELKTKAINKAVETAKKVETAMYNPGHAVNKGIETIATNPVGTVVYGSTSWAPVPSSVLSVGAEKVAKKIPWYERSTKRLGEWWRNSASSKRLDEITLERANRAVKTVVPILA